MGVLESRPSRYAWQHAEPRHRPQRSVECARDIQNQKGESWGVVRELGFDSVVYCLKALGL